MEVFFVYIIFSSKPGKYYIGYTSNIGKRLNEHNTGISAYTSKASDWELKWIKEFQSREEAMAEGKRIKLKKSRKYLDWLINSIGQSACSPESFRGRGHRFSR